MGSRHRPARAAVLGGCLLMVAAGCAAGSAEVSLDRATGAVLADGADRLAEALEAEDTCRALLEADALRERAARALEAGDAPEDVVAETTRVVDAATFALTCEVETAADEAEDAEDAAGADEADEADEADVSASQEPAPAPPPVDDADEPEPEGGGSNGTARGQGPDGDGPPGHRDGRGRG